MINHLLGKAYEEYSAINTLFLPAKADLSDAPLTRESEEVNQGTHLPIDQAYTSAFTGWSIQRCALILRHADPDIDLHRRLFAVIDAKSAETDTITICRRGDYNYEGDGVDWYRIPATEAAIELGAMEPGTFEEHKEAYDRRYPS